MHHIYHTEALILYSRPRGEANRLYTILTRELGLLHAVAQGVRLEKSKLRYTLQDFSHARIDLVRGHEMWRITSATSIASFGGVLKQPEAGTSLVYTARLLTRLITGEEATPLVWDDTYAFYTYLASSEVNSDTIRQTEAVYVYRVLFHLGYVTGEHVPASYMESSISFKDISVAPETMKTIVLSINHALARTGLVDSAR